MRISKERYFFRKTLWNIINQSDNVKEARSKDCILGIFGNVPNEKVGGQCVLPPPPILMFNIRYIFFLMFSGFCAHTNTDRLCPPN